MYTTDRCSMGEVIHGAVTALVFTVPRLLQAMQPGTLTQLQRHCSAMSGSLLCGTRRTAVAARLLPAPCLVAGTTRPSHLLLP
jgi:hypothetical protein